VASGEAVTDSLTVVDHVTTLSEMEVVLCQVVNFGEYCGCNDGLTPCRVAPEIK
jgi:hypothetical protein